MSMGKTLSSVEELAALQERVVLLTEELVHLGNQPLEGEQKRARKRVQHARSAAERWRGDGVQTEHKVNNKVEVKLKEE